MSTLEEAFEQASADHEQVEDTADAEESTPVEETDAEDESVETPEGDGQDGVETEESDEKESFTSVDPNELPDELKGIYKSLQGDYTKKTQELAKQRKETDSRVAELEKQLEELQKPEQEQPQRPKSQQELLQEAVKNQLNEERVEGFREEAIAAYQNADPRLNEDGEEYDQATDLFVGQVMDQSLERYVQENGSELGFDTKGELQKALSQWDQYLKEQNKKYMERQSKLAKEKQKKVQKANPKTSGAKSRPGKVSLQQAIQLAQQK